MQRYEIDEYGRCYVSCSNDGTWVRFPEVIKLIQTLEVQLEDTNLYVRQLEAQLAACEAATYNTPEIKPGEIGWSSAYARIIGLRANVESLEDECNERCVKSKKHINEVHSAAEQLLNAENALWLAERPEYAAGVDIEPLSIAEAQEQHSAAYVALRKLINKSEDEDGWPCRKV